MNLPSFNTEEACKYLRAKHAKLNELTEDQSAAANEAILEALNTSHTAGLLEGVFAEQKQRVKILIPILTFRTFIAAFLSVPLTAMFLTKTNNAGLSLLASAVVVTLVFFVMDKFFYQVFPVLLMKMADRLRRKNKDELPK